MQKRDLIQANASLENLRQNLDMKDIAKEILLEENYNKFIISYKFQFVRISGYLWQNCGPGMPGPQFCHKYPLILTNWNLYDIINLL